MKGRKDGILPSISNQGVAELGHELGNVLNGLLGMARLVRDSGLNAEQERWLRAIEHSGRQMRWLVDAFRCDTVPPGERIRPEPIEVDGIELLEQAVLAHAPSARERNDRLLLAIDTGLPRYWRCDPRLLRQVLDNLLGNALKFTHLGEVVLEASRPTENGLPSDGLTVAVADSGPGIDPALGQRIFGAYERGSGFAADQPGGQGLGLFICRRIAEAMGGSIGCSDSATGGARLELHLPGVFAQESATGGALPTGLLRTVECTLDLSGVLHASVAGCLARLGVAWRPLEPRGEPGRDGAADSYPGRHSGETLCVNISELAATADHPGPALLLSSRTAGNRVVGCKTLQPPILECSLGPLLLELALEWHWLGGPLGDRFSPIGQIGR